MYVTTLRLLGLMLLSSTAVWASKTAQIGLTSGEDSRMLHAPLNDCHDLDEEDVTSLYLSKKCMVFTGPACTGNRVQLAPGEHASNDPVPLGSVFCMP